MFIERVFSLFRRIPLTMREKNDETYNYMKHIHILNYEEGTKGKKGIRMRRSALLCSALCASVKLLLVSIGLALGKHHRNSSQ